MIPCTIAASRIVAGAASTLGISAEELQRLTPIEAHAEVRERLRTIEGQREIMSRHEELLAAFSKLIRRCPINRAIGSYLENGGVK